jgi:hypothetical protein
LLVPAAALLCTALSAGTAMAGDPPSSGHEGETAAPAPGSAALEEQIRQQAALLEAMRGALEQQRAEIDELRRRLDAREGAAREVVATAPAPTAPPAGPDEPKAAAQDDSVAKRVDALEKRFGNVKLAGDIQLRYEGFFNQGFDAPADVSARNRFRVRLRAQLTGEIAKNFDWGLRLASGSFDNPISPQQTFTDYYNRKPIGIDRAYLHFDSKTEGVALELTGGKFDTPWKHTAVTFDEDVQPEGIAEKVRVDPGKSTPLRALEFTAWQLPYRERSIGADAVLFGGQVLTDWKFSDNWAATLSGTFHDFEQVDVIPPAVNVSPTLVNAGFDYGTTNTVVVNPFTGLPEYRSEYRVIDAIGELRYGGFGKQWPLVLRGDWIHNTSAFNNQKDGGTAEAILGRRQEAGDWSFDYVFWKVEREAFPSVFMDSEMVIQTNSVTHAVRARYMLQKQVEFAFRYFATRRLATTLPDNRWLNHLQFDVQYRF